MKDLTSVKRRIEELQKKAKALRLGDKPWETFYLAVLAMEATIEHFEPPKNSFTATREECGGVTPCQAGQDFEKFPLSELEIERRERLLCPLFNEEKALLKKNWFVTLKGHPCSAKEKKEIRLMLEEYKAWRHQGFCFLNDKH